MELKLENGRPADTTGRLEKEIRTYDFLDALQVPYQRIDHETLMTIEACKDVDKVLDAVICKNLFLCNRQKTNFYLLLLPGDKKFKTKEVSSQLGVARLSFGNETYMEKFLDITPGSVSVLGLMNDKENRVQLLIDETSLFQNTHGTGDAWLGITEFIRNINSADGTVAHFKQKDRLQIVFTGFLDLHVKHHLYLLL